MTESTRPEEEKKARPGTCDTHPTNRSNREKSRYFANDDEEEDDTGGYSLHPGRPKAEGPISDCFTACSVQSKLCVVHVVFLGTTGRGYRGRRFRPTHSPSRASNERELRSKRSQNPSTQMPLHFVPFQARDAS